MSEQSPKQPPHEYQRFLQSLPADWRCKEIRQLGTVVGGGTPSREVPSFWRGTVPWVTPGEVSGNATKFLQDTNEHISASGLAGSGANLLPAGSLMVTTRATLGALAINAVPMATNQGFKSIVFKEAADSAFYLHLFERVQPELVRRASGTTFLEISAAEFARIEVPSPIANEKRLITKVFDNLDTAIHETEAIIAKLEAVKQGLLHDLLTRGIDANGELRPPQAEAPQLYKESPLGLVPRNWRLTSVVEAGEVKLGRQRSPVHQRGRHMRPYLRVANVFDGYIDYSDVLEMNFTPLEQQTFSLKPGDILLNEGQSLELVGRCAVYEGAPGSFCFQNTLIRFRALGDTVPGYARYVFKYWLDTGRFARVARQTTSVAHLGADRLAEMVFPAPSRWEQERIAEQMGAVSYRIELEAAQLVKLRQQKAGLMDDLLTGRVRVTPLLADAEPEKEPA